LSAHGDDDASSSNKSFRNSPKSSEEANGGNDYLADDQSGPIERNDLEDEEEETSNQELGWFDFCI